GANLNIPSPAASNVMLSPSGSGTHITTTSVSSVSSPLIPDSMALDSMSPSSTFFAEEFARDISMAGMKPFVNSTPGIQISHEQSLDADEYISQMISKSNSNASSTASESSSNDNTNSSFMVEAALMIDNDADLYLAFIFNDDLISLDEKSKQLLSNFELNYT